MRTKKTPQVIKIFLILFCIISAISFFASNFLIKIEMRSIPCSFAFKTFKQPSEFKKNDIVLFNIKHKLIPSENHIGQLAKYVGCIEGEYLYVDGMRDFYCEGKYIGHAKTKSETGQAIEPFQYSGKIPKGYFFAIGTNINSFDSKYFGLVKNEQVKKILYPLF
jgi:type IV secretory pathway protease TraF